MESFSGACKPTLLTQVKNSCFAQPETTSGQKSAYAKHDVPLIRPLESPDEDFVMIKPQFQGKTKELKGIWVWVSLKSELMGIIYFFCSSGC